MKPSTPLLLTALTLLGACKSAPPTAPDQPAPPVDPAAPPAPTPAPVTPTPGPALPEPEAAWYHDAVFYEIFVRSFQDSDGDGIGDLKGIIDRLDYLNDGDPATTSDLGVTALWLMPIFESPSYHGYDVTDYYKVEPDYGTEADLKALLNACHQRGIKVIVDFMLNHTSVEHPWFVEAASDPSSPYRDWYIFEKESPGWTQPWGNGPAWHKRGDEYYYGVFWSGMPDLDFTNPAVEAEFIQVADHWLDLGLDGFRLDAIRHLVEDGSSAPDVPATHPILKRMAAAIKAEHPGALLIGEIWAGPEEIAPYYGRGDELDMAFDFNLSGGIIAAVQHKDGGPLKEALAEDGALPVQRMAAPFITNHDMDRVAGILGGDVPGLKLTASALMALPGTPFVYYGEEIGLKNTAVGGDEAKRAPMQWEPNAPAYGFTAGPTLWAPALGVGQTYSVAAQAGDPQSLLNHYRRLIQVREAHPSLRRGLLFGVHGGTGAAPLILERAAPGEVAVIALNFGDQDAPAQDLPLSGDALKAAGFGAGTLSMGAQTLIGAEKDAALMAEGAVLRLPGIPARSAIYVVITPP